jgi:hypothetical protein
VVVIVFFCDVFARSWEDVSALSGYLVLRLGQAHDDLVAHHLDVES